MGVLLGPALLARTANHGLAQTGSHCAQGRALLVQTAGPLARMGGPLDPAPLARTVGRCRGLAQMGNPCVQGHALLVQTDSLYRCVHVR